ncbi:MAG: Holliday junction resolvase RuvX [Mollicutes bacterium]|nr:Holliday junction resolvase RuvX [Mollicutes bacterium]
MKQRYLGLDLGTKTLGVAISDATNSLVFPKLTIKFSHEDYDDAINKLKPIINDNYITDVVIGMPINMDGSYGFASDRTKRFIPKLEECNVVVHTVDERLTSIESERILRDCNIRGKDLKNKVDMQSACLILESYLRSNSEK